MKQHSRKRFGCRQRPGRVLLEELLLMEHEEDDAEIDLVGSDGDDDEGISLFPCERELCDRSMKMTRHHLIPRSNEKPIAERCCSQ